MLNVYIHGAFASPTCFDHIRANTLLSKDLLVTYDVDDGLEANVARIKLEIEASSDSKPVNIIGHSMGGLIGLLLYHSGLEINKLVSISAPIGGSKAAENLIWLFPTNKLFKDLSDKNLYAKIKATPVNIPNLFIITERGYCSFFSPEKNDGVVTVNSQTYIPSVNYKLFNYNHHEVLTAPDVCKEINQFLHNTI